MVANLTTLLRTLLSFVVAWVLYVTQPVDSIYIGMFVLTIVIIWMDGLDGFFARLFNECSKVGAMIDILGDRIVENVYWITFAVLGWIPLWVPLVVLARGIVTDGIRSIAFEKGYTAFGSDSMQQSKLGKFIVSSNVCRFSYAVFKAIAFAMLILAHTPMFAENQVISLVAYSSMYIAVFFCVLRAIPVIAESKRFFTE